MGNIVRTPEKNNEILDFSNVTIPQNYTMVKIVTYNIQIKNSIRIRDNINSVIKYIFSSFKNKEADVICIQGINDKYSLFEIITILKRLSIDKKKLYFAPLFEDIEPIKKTNMKNSFGTVESWKISKSNSLQIEDNVTNIILSIHPIISFIYHKLETINFDLFVNNNIITANINVNNSIISIYNVTLSSDIVSANINNTNKRIQQIKTIKNIIELNQQYIKTDERFKKYILTEINLLAGSFEIAEFKNQSINPEYIELSEHLNCVDLYRYINPYKIGNTSEFNERIDYINFLLTQDLLDEKSLYRKKIDNIKKPKDMLKIIFSRYNFHTIDTYVNLNENYRLHYPVENVFMFKIG